MDRAHLSPQKEEEGKGHCTNYRGFLGLLFIYIIITM
jgi:hypothetical protein